MRPVSSRTEASRYRSRSTARSGTVIVIVCLALLGAALWHTTSDDSASNKVLVGGDRISAESIREDRVAAQSECPKCPAAAVAVAVAQSDSTTKTVLVDKIDPESVSPTYKKLVNAFFSDVNPWEGYASSMKPDYSYPHTNVGKQFLTSLFAYARPEFIVEYGSFKGGSAIIMAEVVKELRMEKETAILCVDPWTGDVNMWVNLKGWRAPFLMLDHGMPQVAEQFRVNVIDSGHHDVIVPLQATSLVGIVAIWRLSQDQDLIPLPSVVYLDSAHEKDETFLEVTRVMRALPPGGFMIGDDWSWHGVSHDVKKYINSEEGVANVNKSIPEDFFADWDDSKDKGKFASDGIWMFTNMWLMHKRMDAKAT